MYGAKFLRRRGDRASLLRSLHLLRSRHYFFLFGYGWARLIELTLESRPCSGVERGEHHDETACGIVRLSSSAVVAPRG